jgi:phospholipid/cholesterol/gamma-HCH transport system permease protein
LQLIASHQSLVKKYQKKRDRHLDETFHNRWFQRFLVTLFLGGQVLLRILQGKIDRRKIMEHLVTVGLDSLRSIR